MMLSFIVHNQYGHETPVDIKIVGPDSGPTPSVVIVDVGLADYMVTYQTNEGECCQIIPDASDATWAVFMAVERESKHRKPRLFCRLLSVKPINKF